MRRGFWVLLVLNAGGCAYYNGLYNARGLVRRAESAARDGKDSAAVAAWREAAAKADTVIARYPRSRWTDDALLVAGTAAALAGHCVHGLERLGQWARYPGADAKHRSRASVARGACLVRLGEYSRALDTLGPLVASSDESLSRIAAAWAARAALNLDRPDTVVWFARRARSDPLDGELAAFAIGSSRAALGARLLRQRAPEWRSLFATHAPLRALAKLDRALADSIVQLTQDGRAPRLERARLSVLAASWAEADGDVPGARVHYDRALRMTADTALVTEIVTRMGLLDVRNAGTLADAQSMLERARGKAAGTPELARVDSALRLATRLSTADDSTGASRFLAGEVARDAIGAVPLARALFLGAAREHPSSSLAPKAWLAAADLTPDSGRVWRERVLTRYPDSPYADAMEGKAVAPTRLAADERLLRLTWSRATSATDSARLAIERRP